MVGKMRWYTFPRSVLVRPHPCEIDVLRLQLLLELWQIRLVREGTEGRDRKTLSRGRFERAPKHH